MRTHESYSEDTSSAVSIHEGTGGGLLAGILQVEHKISGEAP